MAVSIKNIKPIPGYVLVEPAKPEKITSSGIYLPESHEEKAQHGIVVSVGADTTDEKGNTVHSPVKKGDVVIYKKWGGNEFKISDTEYQFFKFEDVIATIESK